MRWLKKGCCANDDDVKDEVLHSIKEKRNILGTIKRRTANWIGHILQRNSVLKHVTEGKKDRSDGKTRKKT